MTSELQHKPAEGPRRTPLVRYGFAILLFVIGLALLIGGGQLILLGGSPYYVLCGLTVAVAGLLTWRGNRRARTIYAAMLVATMLWACWEVGFDGWALLPRLAGPCVIGALLWLVRFPLRSTARTRRLRPGWALFALGMPLAAVIGYGLHQTFAPDLADPMFQAGVTTAAASISQSAASDRPVDPGQGEWHAYGNDPGGTRFSPLDQLTPGNVSRLAVAWTLDLGPGPKEGRGGLEVTPLKIGDALYICTSYNDVISVDAETGRVNWRFRSGIDHKGRAYAHCRGVAYYRVPGATGLCSERIYTNTIDARLIALDAATGRRCPGFGDNGETSLLTGMGEVGLGYYFVSSAPTVVRGRIVLGGWVSDGQYWGEPSGVIRAFDAVTGRFAWAFDVGRLDNQGEPPPGESYTRSTPNSWAPMSADEKLGLVYAPTGNATPDYYGAQRRPFDDRFSSSVVAIDAETGRLRWSFQTMHHDLWDYDVASQPTLIDLPTPAGKVSALIQPTKRGEIFLLNRENGRPIAPVAEKPVPRAGHAPGERLAPTQPFSVGLPSFRGADLRERDMWGLTPFDQLWCRIKFRQARYDGPATPPGLTPSISYPGYLGGSNWGGVSVDRDHAIMIVNTNRVGNYNRLLTREEAEKAGIRPIGSNGKGYVGLAVAQANTPYAADVRPFLSPLGAPCNRPPFGVIAAVDLKSRKLLWAHPLGTARDSGPKGLASGLPLAMGVPNLGGSITTRGGLVFIGATQELSFRALDIRSGKILWQSRVPAGPHSTPLSYWSQKSGRQFVAIATGGSAAMQTKSGNFITAYALPATAARNR